MPHELINALVQGGATAVLLGVVLWRLAPRILRTQERLVRQFSEQLERERGSHREELGAVHKDHRVDMHQLTAELHRLARATQGQTLELQRQTCELRELRRDLSQDLPSSDPRAGLPPLPLPEPTATIDLSQEEDP